MSDKFRWCFIGTGRLAKSVAKEILDSGLHTITAVYSRRFESASDFASTYGGKAYEDVEEAFRNRDFDAVYIVTPHSSHFQYAKLALQHKIPVLCEKPVTTSASQAQELFDLSVANNTYFAEAMWTWFSPIANRVKEWLDQGKFGTIQKLDLSYHCNIVPLFGGRLIDPERAGGALLDIGIYPITYLYRLFGKPTAITCRGVVDKGVDLKEEIDMTFADGRTYTATVSMVDIKGGEKIVIKGDKASTKINFFHMTNHASLKKGLRTLDRIDADGSILNEFNLSCEEIRQGKIHSDYVKPEDTVTVLHLMDECRRQMNLVYPFENGLPE